MARPIYPPSEPSSPSPSSSPPSPPVLQPTNTLAVTSLPKSFFDPLILDMLRDHFASFGEINQWVPLQGFGRIIIVYEHERDAEMAKQKSDPIVVDPTSDDSQIVLRVYRADPNPLIPRGERSFVPHSSYLKPPAIEKNFLISPPGSPPVGWEQVKEDPPNSTPLAEDLIQALRKLQTFDDQPAFEQLLDPLDGSGVSVYVENCDAEFDLDVSAEDWVYGETAPARDKWRHFATAMPPIS
ncbi:Calcipressin-domain-containing protein [Gymnopilus junonius]|uniref:Calcipressin-domain-containing protein n=1 Tax=Gymnopilus junonius TaxID=109634 RepID=A0A9P5NNC2_GYMJU|nr:Calcipressin-domain-containing protein [Gymnopilus junonius]